WSFSPMAVSSPPAPWPRFSPSSCSRWSSASPPRSPKPPPEGSISSSIPLPSRPSMSDSASSLAQVSAALTAVADRIDYTPARVGELADEEIARVDLCTDPHRLAALVDSTAAGRQLTDPVVAASVLSLSYAYRVAGTSLAIGFLT